MQAAQILCLLVTIVSASPQGYGGHYGDLVYEPESQSVSYPQEYPGPIYEAAPSSPNSYVEPHLESPQASDPYPFQAKPQHIKRKIVKRPLKISQVNLPRPVSSLRLLDESPYSSDAPEYSTPYPEADRAYSSTPQPQSSPVPTYSTTAPSYSTPSPNYPEPSYSSPKPDSYSPRNPKRPAPKPAKRVLSNRKSYSAPKPTYEDSYTPKSAYQAPQKLDAYYDSAESVYSPKKEAYPQSYQKSSFYDEKYGFDRYQEKDPYFNAPATYNYGYEVADGETDFNHHENRDGSTTKGEYRVALPDGRIQVVRYIADENGYNAQVSYEGEARYPEYSENYLQDKY